MRSVPQDRDLARRPERPWRMLSIGGRRSALPVVFRSPKSSAPPYRGRGGVPLPDPLDNLAERSKRKPRPCARDRPQKRSVCGCGAPVSAHKPPFWQRRRERSGVKLGALRSLDIDDELTSPGPGRLWTVCAFSPLINGAPSLLKLHSLKARSGGGEIPNRSQASKLRTGSWYKSKSGLVPDA
jgi:hypothetical protein